MMRKRWRIASAILASPLGVAYVIATTKVTEALDVVPFFPAFSGDDDFNTRFIYFGVGVVPSFMLLSAWIAYRVCDGWRATSSRVLGVLIGTAVTFVAANRIVPSIRFSPGGNWHNLGVLLMFVTWVLLSFACAVGFARWAQRLVDDSASPKP